MRQTNGCFGSKAQSVNEKIFESMERQAHLMNSRREALAEYENA